VDITGTLQARAWEERRLPPIERVRSGIWSVPVPIPQNPLRYTLCHLVEGDTGWVVIDPGWADEEGWAQLLAGLAAAGATPSDVVGIVATHVHADHHALSGRLREASGAWVAMHPLERDTLPERWWGTHNGVDVEREAMAAWGVPPEIAEELVLTEELIRGFLRMAEPDVLLGDGELVPLPGRALRAVWTPGHTPGHLCLHEEREQVLLTGDHLLPRISPNIAASHDPAERPLANYLASLERTADFDAAEALPAHEYRFRGIAERARQLRQHHRERCQEILTVTADLGKPTAWEITVELSWSRGWSQVTGYMRRAALSETVAHLDYLLERGEMLKDGDRYRPAC
jgi:glyoxylase-like metal-dependent hydrolase (beta-lactamase superfamily II)